jgi:hypothetical protein
MNAWLAVVFCAVSLPAFGMGYAMREKRRIDLLSGVDPKRIADPEGLARFAGNSMYAIGGVGVATGFALAVAPKEAQFPISIAFVVVTNLLVLLLIVGLVRRTRMSRER